MGLPKGPEGQGLPEVRTSVPDTLGLLGREGRARGGGQGPAWEAAGTLCGLLRRVCPKAGPGYPGGTADCSPGVQGRSVLRGANLKVPGSSGFRGNSQIPAQMQPRTSRGPRESLSRAVWKPLTLRARLAPRGQDCCAQESQQSRDVQWDCPGPGCAEGGDLGTQVSSCWGPGGQPLIPFCREGMPPSQLVDPRAPGGWRKFGSLRTSGWWQS